MDRPLVFLDTETANARGAPHLIELGAVRVVDGEIVGEFARLVRPEVPVEPETTAVHGLTDDDLRDADDAATVLAAFSEWAGDDWFVAHDARRDARVLAFEYVRAGLEPPRGAFFDTLALARTHLPDATDHQLDTLVQELGLEGAPSHRALADAVYCWQVFERILEQRGGDEGLASEALAGRAGPITIAAQLPTAPRLPRRLRALAEAARDGGRVTLLYGDGEAPSSLPVLPKLLYSGREHGYLEAECGLTGALKTYRIDRIQRVLLPSDASSR